MKRNLLLLSLLSCTLLSGCNKIPSESVKPSETVQPSESVKPSTSVKPSESVKPTYKIVITDIDGENLGSKDIELTENTSVFDDLVANFDVNYTTSEYGPYLSSINNSVIDVNYYLAIYENNQAASTGVDGLVADENDVFEFKVECWNTLSSGYGTLDDYDLLVDKAIYGYMKRLDLSTSTTFKDSTFWDLMTIKLAMNNFYDSNLFNYNKINSSIKEELQKTDVTSLTGATIYKYYLYSKAVGNDTSALKTYVTSYVETLSDTYDSYVTPFIIAACHGLEINCAKIDTLTSVAMSTDFTWGPDVTVWQYATSSLYNQNIDKSILNQIIAAGDYGNCCGNALVLQAFAASNENVRDSKYEVNGKDMIETLFDNYYNESTNTIEYTKGVENTFSENQVIASLMSYKVCRDTGKKANIYE